MTRRVAISALLFLALSLPASARGQFGFGYSEMMSSLSSGRSSISGNGTSTVVRSPSQLRVYIQLVARAQNIEEALTKLQQRQDAATAQLQTLKANKKSIKFSPPNLSNYQNSRSKQLEAMVMEQLRNRGKKSAKGPDSSKTVTVSSTLVASWSLENQNQEQLLIMFHGLQEKVKQADLSGSKELEKLSPEEEELAEETNKMISQHGEEATPLGQPQFLFVATLPAAEREKALAMAIEKAKAEAAQLARSAKVGLGPLVGISGGCRPQLGLGEDTPFRYGHSNPLEFVQRAIEQSVGDDGMELKPEEAIGTEPGKLRFTCNATVTYDVAK